MYFGLEDKTQSIIDVVRLVRTQSEVKNKDKLSLE